MTTFASEITLIKRLHQASFAVDLIEAVAHPALAVAATLGWGRSDSMMTALQALDRWQERSQFTAAASWRLRYRTTGHQRSPVVRALVKSGDHIGTLRGHGSRFDYHDVFGIPVAIEEYEGSEIFYSPATIAQILDRVRQAGSRWVIDDAGALTADTGQVPPLLAAQTREIIERIRPYTQCRAWVLWGPPRGGKSIAARQIASEIGGGWVRICGKSATSPVVWAAVRELKPAAVILDDLDACAQAEDSLLAWLEDARQYCRVIISTMNILPGGDSDALPDHKPHELRGALLTAGRAADERPRLYDQLDPEVRQALAPDVPEALRPPDLLAAYLVELQNRATHGGVTQADVDEQRERMIAVGDR